MAFRNEMTRTTSPRIEGEQVKPPGNRRDSLKPGLSIGKALIRLDQRDLKVHLGGDGKRNPVFRPIDLVLVRVEFDPHD